MIGEGGDLVYISKTWLWLLNGERRRSGSRSGSEREARMRVGAPIPPSGQNRREKVWGLLMIRCGEKRFLRSLA